MQFAATILDAVRRLEEASAVFRLKSRNATEEYAEWTARWTDSRAQKFALQHIEPQRDWIEQGAGLCNVHASFAEAAQRAAEDGEREISSFFAAQSLFESASDSAQESARSARDLASRAETDSARAQSDIDSLRAAIAATLTDPGW